MKSLLIFTENYFRGGGNRYMIDMTNGLSVNYEQTYLVSNAGGIFPEDTARLSRPAIQRDALFITRSRIANVFSKFPKPVRLLIAVCLIVLEPVFLMINTIILARLIQKLKPALILSCNGGYPAAQACLAMVIAARISQVTVVLSIVSMPARRKGIMWLYEKTLDALVWKSANLVVVNAKNIAAALSEFRGMPPETIRIVYNGLEDKQTPVRIKEDNGQIVIGCVARMDKAKGVLFLFEAFVQLARNRPEMRLVLAGQGDVSAEISRRIETLGMQNRVQMLGHYEGDVSTLLATFDIYVFPSLWEGFPYSIVEALRSSCVIVATRVGGISEAVADGVEGLLILPGSINEIIEAVEKLLNNRDLGKTLAGNARAKFERELTIPKMHKRVRDVFAELEKKEVS